MINRQEWDLSNNNSNIYLLSRPNLQRNHCKSLYTPNQQRTSRPESWGVCPMRMVFLLGFGWKYQLLYVSTCADDYKLCKTCVDAHWLDRLRFSVKKITQQVFLCLSLMRHRANTAACAPPCLYGLKQVVSRSILTDKWWISPLFQG